MLDDKDTSWILLSFSYGKICKTGLSQPWLAYSYRETEGPGVWKAK